MEKNNTYQTNNENQNNGRRNNNQTKNYVTPQYSHLLNKLYNKNGLYYDFIGVESTPDELELFSLYTKKKDAFNVPKAILLNKNSINLLLCIKRSLNIYYYAQITQLFESVILNDQPLTQEYYCQVIADLEVCMQALQEHGISYKWNMKFIGTNNSPKR